MIQGREERIETVITMSLLRNLVVLTITGLSLGSVACSIGQTRHEIIEYDPHLATAGKVCSSPFVKVDVKSLTACKAGGGKGTGKGHCYPKAKTGQDDATAAQFEDPACKPDEVCVGDNILEAGGGELKKCTFKATGKAEEGRCMANLARDMAANFSILKSTEEGPCDADEACSPCTDPRTKEDTHICKAVGVYEKECSDGDKGKQIDLCCAGLGICMPADSVPGGAADSLPRDACKKDDAPVCVPASLVDGKGQACEIAGAPGMCLPFCFADMVKGAQAGLRSSCNALSFCLPCSAAKLAGFDMPGCT